MRKTSVYLDEDDIRRLAMIAELEGESQSEVLRKAIRAYVPRPRGRRQFAVYRAGEGPGGSIADIDERELLKGFGS